ncbi:50S ribosomal protein L11 [Methanocaldococcus lauensis]|uniref:Large ribosomal subunit protein uL11 n=1 Tax=Methanocaldococcus lauensis TaxID=2546128 RepID=A0A8D6PVZ1_9EURY|nr:50S ribosomal protein L11 [Methanocaldococcus lauensis]CAB3287777.1 50S ribosomal protein L11 [Methanocaldococcus lauensis]CAB3288358.1 50S ribosomal protein L11 [Methanocaldococcus lauensis]
MAKEVVEVLITGGKATAGPPLGPAIGPLGVNVMQVVKEINEKTKDYEGMQVPVKVIVDTETRKFEIEVGIPPTTALIKKELGIETAAHEPRHEVVGNLTLEQVIKIAKMKMDSMLSYTLKNAVKEVLGTCGSMGVTVEGKDPKEVQKEIDAGVYDEYFKEDEKAKQKE